MQRADVPSIPVRPFPDSIRWWMEQYFLMHVTSSTASVRIQKRDLNLFFDFLQMSVVSPTRRIWTPTVSGEFMKWMRRNEPDSLHPTFSDRTIDRVVAHLKTFSKWIHKLMPFPLGDPMESIRRLRIATELKINRALTNVDREKILKAADELLLSNNNLKQRTGYRPYRNRAILYTLIETGMPRKAITELNLMDVDFENKNLGVYQRGNLHTYQISDRGLKAIRQYVRGNRRQDAAKWNECTALFLTAETVGLGKGRLTPGMINAIWNTVCKIAGVKDKTPHSARHAMGKHIMEKTGSAEAVRNQLGHSSTIYAAQYSSVSTSKIKKIINER